MPLSPTALKRAQDAARLAVATDHSDRPSVIYDTALIQAYLSDEAVWDAVEKVINDGRINGDGDAVLTTNVLRAIGGR